MFWPDISHSGFLTYADCWSVSIRQPHAEYAIKLCHHMLSIGHLLSNTKHAVTIYHHMRSVRIYANNVLVYAQNTLTEQSIRLV